VQRKKNGFGRHTLAKPFVSFGDTSDETLRFSNGLHLFNDFLETPFSYSLVRSSDSQDLVLILVPG
jgi:hypothetical protein